MTTTSWIIVLLVLALKALAIYWFFFRKKEKPTDDVPVSRSSTASSEPLVSRTYGDSVYGDRRPEPPAAPQRPATMSAPPPRAPTPPAPTPSSFPLRLGTTKYRWDESSYTYRSEHGFTVFDPEIIYALNAQRLGHRVLPWAQVRHETRPVSFNGQTYYYHPASQTYYNHGGIGLTDVLLISMLMNDHPHSALVHQSPASFPADSYQDAAPTPSWRNPSPTILPPDAPVSPETPLTVKSFDDEPPAAEPIAVKSFDREPEPVSPPTRSFERDTSVRESTFDRAPEPEPAPSFERDEPVRQSSFNDSPSSSNDSWGGSDSDSGVSTSSFDD